MIKKAICTAAILMVAVYLPAQNKNAGINLSVWKGISTQSLDTTQASYINVGIFSTMNRLNGFGVNVLGSVVRRGMSGVQLSGLSNIVGGSMRGVQFSGISNISGNSLKGISASGLINIVGNDGKGFVLSGLTNIAGDSMSGLTVSGLMNVTGKNASGVQLSGMASISGEDFKGMMVSGLMNVTGKSVAGLQCAGILNVAGNAMAGIQFGLCNYATDAHGLQIGLVNFHQDEMKGLQLGLINANPETEIQLLLYGGNTTAGNVGVRFKNRLLYTVVGAGGYNANLNDKFSIAASYRAGLSFPIYKGLSLSGDMGYEHIETLKNKGERIPQRLYALQARVNIEYMLTKKFGIFATGGYGWTRHYGHACNFDKRTIAEAGIIFSPKQKQ